MEFCPVCVLRKGLAGVGSGQSSFEEAAKPTPVQALQRFEHYELVRGEDGKPIELGRGSLTRGQFLPLFMFLIAVAFLERVEKPQAIDMIDSRSVIASAPLKLFAGTGVHGTSRPPAAISASHRA